MERFDLARAWKHLPGRAAPLTYVPGVSSTQDLARHLAARGWPDGTVVVADYQFAGRGRQGRSWWAPRGTALLFSLLTRPALHARRASQLTMAAAVAAAEGLESLGCKDVAVKWPNDLYVQGRKIGGILLETQISANAPEVELAIVGVGINLTVDFSERPELQATATSLHEWLHPAPDRVRVLAAFLRFFDPIYASLRAGGSCHQHWARRLLWLGQPVSVHTAQGEIVGIARGVTVEGALLLEMPDGEMESIWAGDVTLRPAD